MGILLGISFWHGKIDPGAGDDFAAAAGTGDTRHDHAFRAKRKLSCVGTDTEALLPKRVNTNPICRAGRTTRHQGLYSNGGL